MDHRKEYLLLLKNNGNSYDFLNSDQLSVISERNPREREQGTEKMSQVFHPSIFH